MNPDVSKLVRAMVESGQFKCDGDLKHEYEGRIGNLCNEKVKLKLEKTNQTFNYKKIDQAYQNLLGRS